MSTFAHSLPESHYRAVKLSPEHPQKAKVVNLLSNFRNRRRKCCKRAEPHNYSNN